MSPTFQKDGQPFVGIPTGASFAFGGVQTRAAGDAVPSWVSIDSTTGTITTAPGADDVADDPYTVPVTVTYSDGTIDNVDAKITVTEKAATDKAGLAAEIAKESEVKGAGGFKNASQEKKQAYKDALAKADEVLKDSDATQAEVDAAKEKLENAQKALDGKETDKSGLQSSISDANGARGADSYKNATDGAKQALEEALKEAAEVNEPQRHPGRGQRCQGEAGRGCQEPRRPANQQD